MRGIQQRSIVAFGWRFVYRFSRLRDRLRRKGTKSHILMFHQVREQEKDCVPDDFSVSAARFESILAWHVQHGYRFAGIEEIAGTDKRGGVCCLTFDDGYADILRVLSVLHKYNAPFCVYVITDRIGQEGYLSAEQLRRLAADPLCTVGSHTCTHPQTRYLTAAALERELTASKARLEELLGPGAARHFAFPYGTLLACSALDRGYVKRAGYATAATTAQVPLRRRHRDPYALPRFDASRKDILEVL